MESQDGIRCSWNILPSTKTNIVKAHIPMGVLYTPMKDTDNLFQVEYRPLVSKSGAYLNPFCKVDFNSKTWIDPIDGSRNQFPKEYAQNISPDTLPAELMPEYTTIEYVLQNQNLQNMPPSIYLFVIDTCIPAEELQAIKDSIF